MVVDVPVVVFTLVGSGIDTVDDDMASRMYLLCRRFGTSVDQLRDTLEGLRVDGKISVQHDTTHCSHFHDKS
jgi:hypothetical protein